LPNSPELAVSPDKVVERLCRTELGLALWRAAIAEETVDVLRERITQLEQQKSPAAQRPDQSQ
jgi:hypothetical protein